MTWKIPNGSDVENLWGLLTMRCSKIYQHILEEFGPNGVFVLALFALFLLIIIFIYIKAVADTFKAGEAEEADAAAEPDGLFYEFTADPDSEEISDELRAHLEAEKELSRDLIAASNESDDFLHISEDYSRLKEVMQRHAQEKEEKLAQEKEELVQQETLSPLNRAIRDRTALILKLLGRGVSDAKTAQTLYFHYGDNFSAEDILQQVRSLRDFIGLANAQQFATLPNANALPDARESLQLLAEKGDNSYCLDLLKNLTQQYVSDAGNEKGLTQQMLYAQAANYACLAGNFAGFDDPELAFASYNLATEIFAESVNAWSRLGDAYLLTGNPEKALLSYLSVIELGDPALNGQQLANAKANLATYYQRQGLAAQAEVYKKESDDYYAQYGLKTPLTPTEQAATDIIIGRQDITDSLATLLA